MTKEDPHHGIEKGGHVQEVMGIGGGRGHGTSAGIHEKGGHQTGGVQSHPEESHLVEEG